MSSHFPFSIFRFPFALLCSLVLLTLQSLAAPLVLKDDYRSPRNKERPLRKATRLIVLHTTEAHARSSLNKLSERGEAHYCVTEKGEVYRIIDRDREAFHAGRSMWNAKEECDEYSIGIEVVGHHDQSMPLPQLEALRLLLERLKKLYGIPDAQVVCHSHVAYGAPNTWHKQKHRGRKRCGMLFAMPSVRTKLGLKARPKFDPDVNAKRLVQADPYLASILYGAVDTMAAHYGRGRPQTGIAPAATAAAKTKPVKAASPQGRRRSARTVAAKPGKPAKPTKSAKSVAKPIVSQTKPVTPPPVKKPPLIVPKTPEEPMPEPAKAEEEGTDWLRVVGLKGGYFRKKAKLVVPTKSVVSSEGDADPEEEQSSESEEGETQKTDVNVLPLPKDLYIGKMGDGVKDLSALAKLPDYSRGGPVTANLSPFKIAGTAWRSPSTYYYTPSGKIVTGDKVDEKAIEIGTFIFYKK